MDVYGFPFQIQVAGGVFAVTALFCFSSSVYAVFTAADCQDVVEESNSFGLSLMEGVKYYHSVEAALS